MNGLALWLAQGFGLGRIPVAPGTFGSLGGLLWFLVLVQTGHPLLFCLGLLCGLLLSVWACGAAERILRLQDPGCIVLDEISALPLAFLPWTISLWRQQGAWPAAENFLLGHHWIATLALFGLFRLFDITKPWPVRQSQKLHGGWGVTADDILAAIYAALVSLLVLA